MLLYVIDSFFFKFLWRFNFLQWRGKLEVFLNNQEEKKGILQNFKTLLLALFLQFILNNKVYLWAEITTGIIKSCKYFPLLHTMHWAQNWHIVCDVYKSLLFNRTRKNSLMNANFLCWNGERHFRNDFSQF